MNTRGKFALLSFPLRDASRLKIIAEYASSGMGECYQLNVAEGIMYNVFLFLTMGEYLAESTLQL